MNLDKLVEHLTSIDQRLTRLEQAQKISSPSPRPQPQTSVNTPAQSLPQAPHVPSAWEKPGTWLGFVAVLCFVLAAGFIIKLSIDSGWLTPERQIGLAAVLGISLIGAGFSLMKKDREYASLLPAAGTIVLYATVFAAHRVYGLIPFEVALACTSAVSALCIWLYSKIENDVYAITAAVGTYLAPIFLGLRPEDTFSLYYFILCSVAFASISIWVRSRLLTMISAYLAILATAYIGLDLKQNELVAAALPLHFLIFSSGTYLYTRQTGLALAENESWSFFPVLLIFYSAEYYFIERIQPGLAPWLSLGFAALLLGFYFSAKQWFPERKLASGPLIFAFAAMVFFHSFYFKILPEDVRPWLFVLFFLAFTFIPQKSGPKNKDNPAPRLMIAAILVMEYLKMVSQLFTHGFEIQWLVVSFAALMSLWVALLVSPAKLRDNFGDDLPLLGAAHLLALSALYRLAYDQGSLAVSAAWLAYAVIVIGLGFSRKDQNMAKSALIVLGFAAGKALLYDAASAPTGLRIVCLLLTGAVLYGAGFLIRQIESWKKS